MIIHISKPMCIGGKFIKDISAVASDISFAKDIFGGYDSASLTLPIAEIEITDWLEQGLGRVIDIWGDSTLKCYKGFVNELELRVGRLALRIGPLLGSEGIINRVWSVYSPMDTSTNPPTYGARTLTTAIQDIDLQSKYGIIEHVFSAGSTTTAVAYQMQQVFLNESKRPKRNHDIGDAETPRVMLTCTGFYQWLEAVIYLYTVASGTVQLSNTTTGKIQNILTQALAINNWCISSDYSKLDYNAVLVPAHDSDDMTCLSVLKAAAALGGPSYEQWMFGIYDELVAEFKAVPTTLEYNAKATSGGLEIVDMEGHVVVPYNILPGRWLLFTDLMPGKSIAADLRDEPRALLIKRVEFTAPSDLRLNGADANTLPQILAQYGLGGS